MAANGRLELNGGSDMPKKLEKKLKEEAEKKGLTEEEKARYVYGTLTKMGWKRK